MGSVANVQLSSLNSMQVAVAFAHQFFITGPGSGPMDDDKELNVTRYIFIAAVDSFTSRNSLYKPKSFGAEFIASKHQRARWATRLLSFSDRTPYLFLISLDKLLKAIKSRL